MVCWTWGRQGSPDLRPAPRLASRLAGLGVGRNSGRPRGWQASHALPDLGSAGVSGPPPGPEAGKRMSCGLPDLGSAGVSGPPPGPEAGKPHTLCRTWGRRGSPDLRPAPRLARLVLILTLSRHYIFRVQVQGLPSLNPCPSLPPSLPLLTVLVSTFSPLRFSFPPCSYSFLIHLFDSSCFHGHLHLISLTSFASTFLALPAFLSLFSLLTSAFQL